MSSQWILETERLALREFQAEDLEPLTRLYLDPEVMKYVTGSPRSEETTRTLFPKYQEQYKTRGFGLWATLLKPDLQFVGRCGLIHWDKPEIQGVEIAYMFDPPRWGRGLATEVAQGLLTYAFDTLRLESVICCVSPENLGSLRVAEKVGFTVEKTTQLGQTPIHLHRMTDRQYRTLEPNRKET